MVQQPHLQTVMMKVHFCIFHHVLLCFRVMVMMRFLFHVPHFLVFPSLPVPVSCYRPVPQASGHGRCPLGYGEYPLVCSSSTVAIYAFACGDKLGCL
jgi:hypothetical protein